MEHLQRKNYCLNWRRDGHYKWCLAKWKVLHYVYLQRGLKTLACFETRHITDRVNSLTFSTIAFALMFCNLHKVIHLIGIASSFYTLGSPFCKVLVMKNANHSLGLFQVFTVLGYQKYQLVKSNLVGLNTSSTTSSKQKRYLWCVVWGGQEKRLLPRILIKTTWDKGCRSITFMWWAESVSTLSKGRLESQSVTSWRGSHNV